MLTILSASTVCVTTVVVLHHFAVAANTKAVTQQKNQLPECKIQLQSKKGSSGTA